MAAKSDLRSLKKWIKKLAAAAQSAPAVSTTDALHAGNELAQPYFIQLEQVRTRIDQIHLRIDSLSTRIDSHEARGETRLLLIEAELRALPSMMERSMRAAFKEDASDH